MRTHDIRIKTAPRSKRWLIEFEHLPAWALKNTWAPADNGQAHHGRGAFLKKYLAREASVRSRAAMLGRLNFAVSTAAAPHSGLKVMVRLLGHPTGNRFNGLTYLYR